MRKSLFMLLLSSLMLFCQAQNRTVSGIVTSPNKDPLQGVSVMIPGTNVGTVTNSSGSFSLSVPASAKTLELSSIGYKKRVVTLGTNNFINVAMEEGTESQLEEVVVGAGGIASKRKDQGYATTLVTSEKLTAAKPTNIAAALTGKVAGLKINATNGGVNPSFRVVLRGQRSLTGNNQALIVLDNVIVPNELLGNLNPEDVENVVVLNGAGASALYGSEASNGALLITTKKGSRTKPEIRVANTYTIEESSYFPKLQQMFGAGSTANFPVYTPDENQQYGPAFDGTLRPVGQPLADGSIQMMPYSPVNGKNSFWQRGRTNQTDISLSGGDERGSTFMSAQYIDGLGTTPKDNFNKTTVRINGKRQFAKSLGFTFQTAYTQNRYDITSQTGTIYGELMQTPANIQIRSYQDWRNDKYSTPDGYYNPFYRNPYFLLDNYRQYTRNDYLTASADLKFAPLSWLDFTYRLGITTRNNDVKSTADKYTYSDFAKSTTHGSYKKTDITGSVGESSFYSTRLTSEFQAAVRRNFNDFAFRFTAGASVRQDQNKSLSSSVSGLVVPGLFNLSNTLVNPSTSESSYKARQLGAYGDLNIGYKGWINLHATGRNDWVSILSADNRSFFYPAVDVSITPMDFIPGLANSTVLSSLKLRGGWSKVGQVNLGGNFGAYQLDPTFSQAYGYPYANGGGFTLDNRIVSRDLRPEITKGWEAGIDAGFFKNRLTTNLTWYKTKTSDQTVATGVSQATGFSSYLLNAALTSSSAIEATVNASPIRSRDWDLQLGANYNYVIENKVLAITADVGSLSLGSGSYAIVGQPFPVIYATAYKRDPQGRVIVDPLTGYPQRNDVNKVLGSAVPVHTLGLNFALSYKNLHLSSQAEYRGGYVTYMNNTTAFDFSGGGLATVAFNRERFVFPNSSYPDPNKPGEYIANTNITVRDGGYGFWTQAPRTGVAENYVASGAFWKLREVTLSYDVPDQVLRRIKFIKKTTISLQGRNLVMLLPKTNLYTDPEYSDNGSGSNGIGVAGIVSAPPSRYYGATLSVTF
ncbi:MAG: SusC/RagA family TonB-linked outer membrane protein [Chitinophagaceae bacterium]|nr:MAG: SusC/RagA family TonB-linked outer membrane protein [Chitinophagaceae bacterium]